ncbi:MAG: DUF4421 domain-containing protein [Bacteroidota bacterium]|nr:DUF4421 domain-containing protein [Bacteroidota bacterium]
MCGRRGIDRRWLFAALCFLAYIHNTLAQNDQRADTSEVEELDTLFVKDYSHMLGVRVFTSTKYNALRIGSESGDNDLIYRPTNQFNIGVGASYKKFILNLGFGIPELTTDRREKFGHSKYLDAQANMFSPERATNLFLQFFKGYHLSTHTESQLGWAEQTTDRPFREDIEQFNFGISTLKIFNSRKYSYRAALNQDAWQRRSQGTWLLGAYGSYYRLRADSSLTPTSLAGEFAPEAFMDRGDFVDLGPMGGYAYTLVINSRFFIMGSAAAGAGLSMHYLETTPSGSDAPKRSNTTWGPGWHLQLRGGIGYNSRSNQVGLTFNHEHIHYIMPVQSMVAWNVGNIRFNIVHRFDKRVGFVDRIMKKLKPNAPAAVEEAVPAVEEVEEEN